MADEQQPTEAAGGSAEVKPPRRAAKLPAAGRDAPPRNPAAFIVPLVLMALCLIFRAMHLMALPIFGDESIYLRWAQAIRDDPYAHAWVSLIDPKPPLHFWLLATVWKFTNNPLYSGRLLSVASAVLCIPALLLFWRACAGLVAPRPQQLNHGRNSGGGANLSAVGYIACLVFIFCPYLAFYQRMALADPIFILEMLAAAWLSVVLGNGALAWAEDRVGSPVRVAAPAPVAALAQVPVPARAPWPGLLRGAWRYAVPFGVVMGLAMLTRQNISYVLWALPIAAAACLAIGRKAIWPCLLAAAVWNCVALIVAVLIWCPMLIVRGPHSVKTRIFYRSSFVGGVNLRQRLAIIVKNARRTFLPLRPVMVAGHTHLEFFWHSGWLWTYLTPPVEILAILAIGWMAWRRQWRLLFFLLFWWGITLGPVIVFGKVAYARYALSGIVPLLLIFAWALTDALALIVSFDLPEAAALGISAAVLAGVFAWPIHAILLQENNWPRQEMVPLDRHQYITGWTGGYAVGRAIRLIKRLPEKGLTVITSNGWGTPPDALWAFLHGRKNVQLAYSDSAGRKPLLRPVKGKANYYWLRKHKYLYTPPQPCYIPPHQRVLYVSPDPIYVNNTAVAAGKLLRRANPHLVRIAAFHNPSHRDGRPPGGNVIIYLVK